jgi:hypothetical protein
MAWFMGQPHSMLAQANVDGFHTTTSLNSDVIITYQTEFFPVGTGLMIYLIVSNKEIDSFSDRII